jgi:hypothetical protein
MRAFSRDEILPLPLLRTPPPIFAQRTCSAGIVCPWETGASAGDLHVCYPEEGARAAPEGGKPESVSLPEPDTASPMLAKAWEPSRAVSKAAAAGFLALSSAHDPSPDPGARDSRV